MDHIYYEESGTISPEVLDNLPPQGGLSMLSNPSAKSVWGAPADPLADIKKLCKRGDFK